MLCCVWGGQCVIVFLSDNSERSTDSCRRRSIPHHQHRSLSLTCCLFLIVVSFNVSGEFYSWQLTVTSELWTCRSRDSIKVCKALRSYFYTRRKTKCPHTICIRGILHLFESIIDLETETWSVLICDQQRELWEIWGFETALIKCKLSWSLMF